jgi:hypothetical protein
MHVDLAKLEQLSKNASPLPWRYNQGDCFLDADCQEIRNPNGGAVANLVSQANAEFIVEVCNAFPALLEILQQYSTKDEAQRRATNCRMSDTKCRNLPRGVECPLGDVCCGEVTPEHWLKFLEQENDED